MAYTLHIRNEDLRTFTVLTDTDIIQRLDITVPLQAAHIAMVQDLMAKGCQYSNQDFDVLSSAFRAVGKSDIDKFNAGFVAYWAPLAR